MCSQVNRPSTKQICLLQKVTKVFTHVFAMLLKQRYLCCVCVTYLLAQPKLDCYNCQQLAFSLAVRLLSLHLRTLAVTLYTV